MANLTASREDFRKDDELLAYPVKAASTIYKGAIVTANSSGFVNTGVSTDKRVVGVAYETVTNSGANGALTIRVWRRGTFQFTASGMTQANVGDKVYVTDDNTVQTSATSTILVGVVTEFISATSVRVKLTPDA